MKKAFLLLLVFISLHITAFSDVLLDFESNTIPPVVSSWTNYSTIGASASTWSYNNPRNDANDSTLKCYQIVKQSSDPYWTGLQIDLTSDIPITTSNNYLHVLVFKTTSSRIGLTYTPDGGAQSPDNWISNSVLGDWTDYVLQLPIGINLKTFAIKIADDPGIYYFDQIELTNSSTSRANTSITIDPTIKYQTIEGWGGSLCWWANIMGGYSTAKIKSICDSITDPVNGLNMNIFRFNIGGGDNPTHNHMRTDGGNMPGYKSSAIASYDWSQDANQRKILQQLIASRIAKTGVNDVIIDGFSNSPPYWMTNSGCSAGSTNGTPTNLQSSMFTTFADYLTEVVKHYHDIFGITFNYLEPFNEPDGNWWKAYGNQEGCYFSNNDQIVMIRDLYSSLSAKNMLSYCQITANDANTIDDGYNTMIAYQSAGDILYRLSSHISVHTYGGSNRVGFAGWAQSNNKVIWQSESGPLNVGGTDAHQMMTISNRIITDMRDLKCTAWIDWQLADDGSPDWGLLVGTYNDPTNPVTIGTAFYIRSQYSRYLKAGYNVVYSSSNNSIAAVSPDQKELVLVISNQDLVSENYRIDLSKFINFGKVQQILTCAEDSLSIHNQSSFFNVQNNSITYNALPESVSTFVIPINQSSTSAVETVSNSNGNMFYAQGVLHTNFFGINSLDIYIYNIMGQLIKIYNKVPAQGVQELNLTPGVYIISTKVNNIIVSKKIVSF